MQFKDQKAKFITFRLNKQLLCQFEQAQLDLGNTLGALPSKQKTFESILVYYLHKRGLL